MRTRRLLSAQKGEARTIRGIISGANKWRYSGPKSNMWQEEQNAFVKSIREGKPIDNGIYMAQSSDDGIMGRITVTPDSKSPGTKQ